MQKTNTPPVLGAAMVSGFAFALLGSIAFSGKAIIVKLAYRHGVDAVTLIMLRMLFALPFFLLLAWHGGRKRNGIAAPTIALRDALGIVALGVSGYYLASYLDFAGLAYISASLERLILYLNPTLVLLLGWVLHGKRIGRAQAIGMGLSYAGVMVVFGHEISISSRHAAWGTVLVFLSAVSYALYMSYSGQMVQRLGSQRLAGLATSVACVLCIAQFIILRPIGGLAELAPEVWWLSLLNATACTVVPVLLVMMAIERIGSGLAAQIGMVGPLSTIAMGVLILDEPMNVWIVLGSVLVFSGIYVCSRWRAQK